MKTKGRRQSDNIEDHRGERPMGPQYRNRTNEMNDFTDKTIEAIRARPRQVETAKALGLDSSVRGMDKKPRLKRK